VKPALFKDAIVQAERAYGKSGQSLKFHAHKHLTFGRYHINEISASFSFISSRAILFSIGQSFRAVVG
jgi:outer membrane cobalamin receptor